MFRGISEFQNFCASYDYSNDVLRVDGRVDEVNMEHWWNYTDGKTEILGENSCPRAAVSTAHLKGAGRPVTLGCAVDTVAVRVLRLPLSVGRTDISGDCGVFRDEGWSLQCQSLQRKIPVTRTEE